MANDLREIPESTRDGKNAGGADIAEGLIVQGHEDAIALAAGSTATIYGVTRQIIKALGGRGSILLRGRGLVMAGSGGYTKGTRLMPEGGGTGKAIPWTSGNSILGVAQTDAAANALGECELLGPGATAQ